MRENPVESLPSCERVRVATNKGYFPVLVETANGTLLAVFRDGAAHMGHAGFLVSSRSEDGGRTWSDPVTVVRTRQYDDRNPAVGVSAEGVVVVAYHANGLYNGEGEYLAGKERRDPAAVHTGIVRSYDGGRSWDEPMLYTDATEWDAWSPYGRIVALPGGEMLMPIYTEEAENGEHGAYLLRSPDGGTRWGSPSLVGRDVNELSCCVLLTGRWLAIGRLNSIGAAARGEGKTHSMNVRWSDDGGASWNDPVPFAPGARLPADQAVLSDGSVLAVYGYRDAPCGVRARRSNDGGETWSDNELVIHDTAKTGDCGYPSVAVKDGWIVVIFYDAGDTSGPWTESDGAFAEVVRFREEDCP